MTGIIPGASLALVGLRVREAAAPRPARRAGRVGAR